jgi:hypothetical protein
VVLKASTALPGLSIRLVLAGLTRFILAVALPDAVGTARPPSEAMDARAAVYGYAKPGNAAVLTKMLKGLQVRYAFS